jgi:hypothetical protein
VGDWFDAAGAGDSLDLQRVWDDGVEGLLRALVQHGALVSLGLTSDGGALGVTVTRDGRWRREYFRDVVQLGGWLQGALDAVKALNGHPAPSGPDNGSRQRRGRSRSL